MEKNDSIKMELILEKHPEYFKIENYDYVPLEGCPEEVARYLNFLNKMSERFEEIAANYDWGW